MITTVGSFAVVYATAFTDLLVILFLTGLYDHPTRGLKEEDIREVADIIADVIENREDSAVIETTKAKVQAICKKFPLYEE